LTRDTVVWAPLGLMLLLGNRSSWYSRRMTTCTANMAAIVLRVSLLLLLLGAPAGAWRRVSWGHIMQVLWLYCPGIGAGEGSWSLLGVAGSAPLYWARRRSPGPGYRAPDMYMMKGWGRMLGTRFHCPKNTPATLFASTSRHRSQRWLLVLCSRNTRHARPRLLKNTLVRWLWRVRVEEARPACRATWCHCGNTNCWLLVVRRNCRNSRVMALFAASCRPLVLTRRVFAAAIIVDFTATRRCQQFWKDRRQYSCYIQCWELIGQTAKNP
jgi:hypothetical protein